MLVLYDHLLTLSDEVRLIWPAKVRPNECECDIAKPYQTVFTQTSIVKVLFLINRYTVPFCLIMTAYGEGARFRAWYSRPHSNLVPTEMAGYHSESISHSVSVKPYMLVG